jgi:hypothetical protein
VFGACNKTADGIAAASNHGVYVALLDVNLGGELVLSMAERNCARWRRESVPVGLREKGCEARFIFVLPCRFIFRWRGLLRLAFSGFGFAPSRSPLCLLPGGEPAVAKREAALAWDRSPICSRTGSTSARSPIGVRCIAASMSRSSAATCSRAANAVALQVRLKGLGRHSDQSPFRRPRQYVLEKS